MSDPSHTHDCFKTYWKETLKSNGRLLDKWSSKPLGYSSVNPDFDSSIRGLASRQLRPVVDRSAGGQTVVGSGSRKRAIFWELRVQVLERQPFPRRYSNINYYHSHISRKWSKCLNLYISDSFPFTIHAPQTGNFLKFVKLCLAAVIKFQQSITGK